MDTAEVQQLADDLDAFVADVFASLTRSRWQERAEHYLRGLMLDGRRKSIQPMAARLAGPHEQALNHFVTNSPWDAALVRRRLAVRMDEAIVPAAWALDDTGWIKYGTASVGVTRQYTGTAGKVTNCQIGVSLNLVTDTASCPVDWRLFVPESWDPASDKATSETPERRRKTGMPDDVVHREKWRLGMDMIDEARGWGLTPPLIVADAGYGDAAEFRQGLEDRNLSYVVGVNCAHTAFTIDAQRTSPPHKGAGRRPPLIYRQAAPGLKTHVLAAGRDATRRVTWREGSRRRAGKARKMGGSFVFLRLRPASLVHRRAVGFDEDLPVRWLIAEWPPGEPEPTRYWLSNLPATTPYRHLVRQAKLRWRIEHDYREVKTGLGLDHYEGRTWQGWHHHTTLVSAAHAFLTLQRLDPKTRAPE
jgi:SRSO17 transposase